jgi:hypothetical protein
MPLIKHTDKGELMDEHVYTGPLEPLVHLVLEATQGYFIRTGKHPTPRNTAEIMQEVLKLLPGESLT